MSETDPGDGECSKNHRIGRFKWVNYRVHTFIPQWNLKVQGGSSKPPPHTGRFCGVLQEGGSEPGPGKPLPGTPTASAVSSPPQCDRCQGLPLRCGIRHQAPRLPTTLGPAGVSVNFLPVYLLSHFLRGPSPACLSVCLASPDSWHSLALQSQRNFVLPPEGPPG